MQNTRTPTGIGSALFSVLMLVTIIVLLQNTTTVQTTVLFRTIAMPLTVLLILTLASGMLSGAVLYRTLSPNKRQE